MSISSVLSKMATRVSTPPRSQHGSTQSRTPVILICVPWWQTVRYATLCRSCFQFIVSSHTPSLLSPFFFFLTRLGMAPASPTDLYGYSLYSTIQYILDYSVREGLYLNFQIRPSSYFLPHSTLPSIFCWPGISLLSSVSITPCSFGLFVDPLIVAVAVDLLCLFLSSLCSKSITIFARPLVAGIKRSRCLSDLFLPSEVHRLRLR